MVDLVGAVIEGLERLGIEQTHQKIEGAVVVRDDGVQGAFPLPQGVEIHVIVGYVLSSSLPLLSLAKNAALAAFCLAAVSAFFAAFCSEVSFLSSLSAGTT